MHGTQAWRTCHVLHNSCNSHSHLRYLFRLRANDTGRPSEEATTAEGQARTKAEVNSNPKGSCRDLKRKTTAHGEGEEKGAGSGDLGDTST